MNLEELKAFDKRLCGHDWFYSYSDDIRVYRRGNDDLIEIKQITAKYEEAKLLYDAWRRFKYSGRDVALLVAARKALGVIA